VSAAALTVPAAATRADATRTAASVAAAFSLSGALVHLVHAPDHRAEWWAYGAFFIACAAGQAALAVAVLRWRGVWPALVGIAGSLGMC
jgi:hypothetical protein